MVLINYHIHTDLCGHGTGSIKQYIEAAITAGISEIGFSEHGPIPEELGQGLSMKPSDTEHYLNQLETQKEQYKNKIKIRSAFEVDYPFLHSFNKKYLKDTRIDYIMGSCHMIDNWIFDHPAYIDEYEKRNIDTIYSSYYDTIESIITSKHFDLIGHFDLVKKFNFRPSNNLNDKIEKIAQIASKENVAIEINTSGLQKPVKEIYPSDEIIEIFFRNNVPITIGTDAHSPDNVDFMLRETIEKLKKIGYRKLSGFKNRKRYDILI